MFFSKSFFTHFLSPSHPLHPPFFSFPIVLSFSCHCIFGHKHAGWSQMAAAMVKARHHHHDYHDNDNDKAVVSDVNGDLGLHDIYDDYNSQQLSPSLSPPLLLIRIIFAAYTHTFSFTLVHSVFFFFWYI